MAQGTMSRNQLMTELSFVAMDLDRLIEDSEEADLIDAELRGLLRNLAERLVNAGRQ